MINIVIKQFIYLIKKTLIMMRSGCVWVSTGRQKVEESG